MGRHLIAPAVSGVAPKTACRVLKPLQGFGQVPMTDVSSKPLAGVKTTARVLGTVITYCLVVSGEKPVNPASPAIL
ncbi:MAG: hypothetical protein LBD53_09200 [Tannerella sp.]|jgi:hypothetical protein|nr:hypothetical protein [Tannerella sp.]